MTKRGHINKRLSRRRFKSFSRLIACFVVMMKETGEAGDNLTLLNDSEKVAFLIAVLECHIDKLPSKEIFLNYLESIRAFLKTKDPNSPKSSIFQL
ncbi:hypothetical protein H0178_23530 [Cytobacillus firmus]|nr:hypothetical protein [Cytobacillus firmus]